jgi:hypothetical protein
VKQWQFALGYGLLGVCVFMAVAGFVLALHDHSAKADRSAVSALQKEVSPGARAAYKAACDAAEQSAAGAGLVLTECKLVKPPKGRQNPLLKGDVAQLVLQVRESGGNYFIIEVVVSKEAYAPKALQVVANPSKAVQTLP